MTQAEYINRELNCSTATVAILRRRALLLKWSATFLHQTNCPIIGAVLESLSNGKGRRTKASSFPRPPHKTAWEAKCDFALMSQLRPRRLRTLTSGNVELRRGPGPEP